MAIQPSIQSGKLKQVDCKAARDDKHSQADWEGPREWRAAVLSINAAGTKWISNRAGVQWEAQDSGGPQGNKSEEGGGKQLNCGRLMTGELIKILVLILAKSTSESILCGKK